MEISYNQYGLQINKKVFSILQFYRLETFNTDLLEIIKESIKEKKANSIILKNNAEIKAYEKIKTDKPIKNLGYTNIGLNVEKNLYHLCNLTENHKELNEKLILLIKDSIKTLKNNSIILKNDKKIEAIHENIYNEITNELCWGKLAYCCHCKKDDCIRVIVLKELGISNKEYTEIKDKMELEFQKLVRKKKPEWF